MLFMGNRIQEVSELMFEAKSEVETQKVMAVFPNVDKHELVV